MNFDTLFQYVLPYCQGCPDAMAMEAIRGAAIEMCERTRMYRVTSSVATVANSPTYTVTIANGSDYQHHGIQSVSIDSGALGDTNRPDLWVNSIDYPFVTPDQAQEMLRDDAETRISFTQNELFSYLSGMRTQVMINPAPPTSGRTIRIVFVVKTAQQATAIADQVGYQSYLVIADGAIARLKGMTGEAWADRGGEMDYRERFDAGLSRLAGRFSMGYSSGPLRVKPR